MNRIDRVHQINPVHRLHLSIAAKFHFIDKALGFHLASTGEQVLPGGVGNK